MRSGVRYTPALAVALVALLIAAGVSAWVLGGRMFEGVAPSGAPEAPPMSGAGPSQVELSADAEDHPLAEAVRSQLQRYFDAINSRDYELWSVSVVPERVAQQPREQWIASIDTAADGTIRVDRIDDVGGGRVLAMVRFVSTQSLEDAPPDLRVPRICWRGAFPMVGDPPRLETGSAGSLLSEPC
ncbi:MAG: hypothetical protein ABS81_31015 [Pseudonocardia sp. SCN 72-86]|mgnify:CR=1 FL=1|nr:MAG: hypothetical protein ABS81_31015 [Pseudonocardia sp. SCN 72-86]